LITNDYADNPSGNNYLVKDLDNGVLTKYKMMAEPELGAVFPTSMRPTIEEEMSFLDEVAEYDFIRFQLNEQYQTPLNVTAFDLAMYPFLRTDLIEEFKDNASLARRLNYLITTLVSGAVRGIGVNNPGFTFEVILADNSIATLRIEGFKNTIGNISYSVTSLTDADGNDVPLEKVQNGRLVFRFDTIDNFIAWYDYMKETYNLEDDHINVTFLGTTIPPEGRVNIVDIVNGEVIPPPLPPEEEREEP
jgi:hypothetical protein